MSNKARGETIRQMLGPPFRALVLISSGSSLVVSIRIPLQWIGLRIAVESGSAELIGRDSPFWNEVTKDCHLGIWSV